MEVLKRADLALKAKNLNIKNKEEVMDGKIKLENEGFMENLSHQFS